MLKKILMASCALMIVCAPAYASGGKPADVGLGAVDSNKDKVVSTAEAMVAADKQFAKLDASKDGKVTKVEFQSAGKAALAKAPKAFLEKNKAKIEASQNKRFAMLDTNKDGNVTKDEMQADMKARHKKMDGNGDGNVTKDELVKFHEAVSKAVNPKKK